MRIDAVPALLIISLIELLIAAPVLYQDWEKGQSSKKSK